MVNIAGSFVFTVVSLYSLYRAWSWSDTDDSSIEMSAIHIVWCIYYNVYIVALLWAGSTMRNEVMNIIFRSKKKGVRKKHTKFLGTANWFINSQFYKQC